MEKILKAIKTAPDSPITLAAVSGATGVSKTVLKTKTKEEWSKLVEEAKQKVRPVNYFGYNLPRGNRPVLDLNVNYMFTDHEVVTGHILHEHVTTTTVEFTKDDLKDGMYYAEFRAMLKAKAEEQQGVMEVIPLETDPVSTNLESMKCIAQHLDFDYHRLEELIGREDLAADE